MPKFCKWFYSFSGIHSFLIGLFLFFIPVFLWKEGFSLSTLSFFIALMGCGYVCTLWIWDRIRLNISLKKAIALSLMSEIGTLTCVFFLETSWMWILLGFVHGIYNGLFWTLQRTLFLDTISHKDTGRKYGNFQIFVFLILKGSILLGSVILEKSGFPLLFLLSCLFSCGGMLFFHAQKPFSKWKTIQKHDQLSFKSIRSFQDSYRSKSIFILDGPFLFFESFFWSLSLFWILQESFFKLGIVVIGLSLTFSILFWITKNIIDHIQKLKNHIYGIGVVLYALSWFGRSVLSPDTSLQSLSLLLLGITFCTSFFRLLFNKRFFDIAKNTTKQRYIYLKSYYSQITIILVFGILGVLFHTLPFESNALPIIYAVAGGFSLLYMLYKPASTKLCTF